LAVIGNCQVAGLIDSLGRLVWGCLPRLDGDPVFCALLDQSGGDAERGVFAVDLLNAEASEQTYQRNTAVVLTRLRDCAGNELQITDFCPRFRRYGRIFRPMMFVRLIEPLHGRPRVRVRLVPAERYGFQHARMATGSNHLRFDAETPYRATTDVPMTAIVDQRPFVLDTPLAVILGPDETLTESPLAFARDQLHQTTEYWQAWVRTLAVPVDWTQAVIRAAITLKLCTYEDTGAVVAALTTSIPEAPDTERNWDYRYCWLRDSFFVVRALNRLGATRTMEGYLRYISNIAELSPAQLLQPVYAISGDAHLEEQEATSLAGYRGIGPVRIGNRAFSQRQHDVYGSIILAATQLFFDERLFAPGDIAVFQRLESFGEQAIRLYDQPDAGPWELRGSEATHTLSAVMCWCACDRLARIAQRLGLGDSAACWIGHATTLRERILSSAWNESRGAFVSHFGGTAVDASALLLPQLGFVSPSDPRFLSTLKMIETELRVGDLMFRYRVPDDFGPPKNAFTTCSFWYVNALAAVGRRDEARVIFEQLLARRNSLGLLSEHIDPQSGEQWGNYPQTYSMVGIISSAVRLSRPWEEVL